MQTSDGCAKQRLGALVLAIMATTMVQAIAFGQTDEPTAAFVGTLSLEQARETALKDNPGIAAVKTRIDSALATIELAKADFSPTVSASLSAGHTEDTPVDRDLPDVDSVRTYQTGARVKWVIFDGFARRYRLLAAQYGKTASEYAYRDAQRLLLQAVTAAFFESLLAREAMSIARQDADFNAILRDETQIRFKAGASARSDVLNFEIRTTRAESSFAAATSDYRVANILLAQLMGVSSGELPQGEEPEPLSAEDPLDNLPDFDSELAYAVTHRPDLLALHDQLAQLEMSLKEKQGEYLPTVDIEATGGLSRQSNTQFNEHRDRSSYVGLNLTWDIFTGNSTRAACARIRAGIRELSQQRSARQLSIRTELRRQLVAVLTNRQQLLLQRSVKRMTTEARDLVRSEYMAGRKSMTRLNEAQNDLVQAAGRLALVRIRFRRSLQDVSAASARILAP